MTTNLHDTVMLCILQCYAVGVVSMFGGTGATLNGYAGVTLAAVRVQYDRLFVLAFSPFLVLILVTVGLKWYRAQKNKSQ